MAEIPRGVYRHWKGTRYLVVAVGMDSNNAAQRETTVVYVSLSPPHTGAVRVRHAAEFLESVPLPAGGWGPRFVHVSLRSRAAGLLRRWADRIHSLDLVEAEIRYRLAKIEQASRAAG